MDINLNNPNFRAYYRYFIYLLCGIGYPLDPGADLVKNSYPGKYVE